MKRIKCTFLIIVAMSSFIVTAQTIIYDYDDAGNRIRRNADCGDMQEIELGSNSPLCEGNNLTLDAGTGFETYSWNGEPGNRVLIINEGGTYFVEGVHSSGCISTDQIIITVSPLPIVYLGEDVPITEGQSIELDAGSGFGYLWDDGSNNQLRTVNAEGTYWVEITDNNGCKNTDEITITTESTLIVNLGPDDSFCTGASIQLDAGDFASYLWNDGSEDRYLTVTNGGTYSVNVTDVMGESGWDAIVITENALPLVNLGDDITAPSNTTSTLYAGSGYFSYLWSDNSTEDYLLLDMSNYSSRGAEVWVTVIDHNNCSNGDTVIVRSSSAGGGRGIANNNFSESDIDDSENIDELVEDPNYAEYRIFPNPNDGKFFIELPTPESIKQIDIFDARGNKIKTLKNIDANRIKIDVSSYSKGLYLIYIREETVSKEFKIIYN